MEWRSLVVDDKLVQIKEPDIHRSNVANVSMAERRTNPDRRRNHLRAFTTQFVKPRRTNESRRETDTHGFHVDFHEPRLMFVVVATLSLCIVDVYATLILLQQGGKELNPIMRKLIEADVWLFFVFKYVVTTAGLFVLLSYKNFRVYKNFSGLHSLYSVLIVYVLLVIYEIRLLIIAMG